jgi:hypothetical protein
LLSDPIQRRMVKVEIAWGKGDMAADRRLETDFRAHPIALERLRKCIERLLLSSDVEYQVRFGNESVSAEFAYSWAAIWSEN